MEVLGREARQDDALRRYRRLARPCVTKHGYLNQDIARWRDREAHDLIVCQEVPQYLPDPDVAPAVANLAAMSAGSCIWKSPPLRPARAHRHRPHRSKHPRAVGVRTFTIDAQAGTREHGGQVAAFETRPGARWVANASVPPAQCRFHAYVTLLTSTPAWRVVWRALGPRLQAHALTSSRRTAAAAGQVGCSSRVTRSAGPGRTARTDRDGRCPTKPAPPRASLRKSPVDQPCSPLPEDIHYLDRPNAAVLTPPSRVI